MFYKVFIFIILVIQLNTSYSGETDVVKTFAGVVEIKKLIDENWIILDNKIIKKIEEPYVSFEQKYNLKKSTILLISTDSGGSGTLPSYFIVELFKNKKYIITNDMYSVDGTFEHSIDKGKLIVDLGYDSGLKKYGIYKNGKLDIKKVKTNETIANEDDCNYLYNRIYVAFSEDSECNKEPYEVGGMATARPVYAMQNDPRINIKPLIEMSKKACKEKKPIKYTEFKKIVCNTANKRNTETRQSSEGRKYLIKYNKNGAVLKLIKTKKKIYLGKDCDVYSKKDGKGIWGWTNGGFKIIFANNKISFPKQEVEIPNILKCRF